MKSKNVKKSNEIILGKNQWLKNIGFLSLYWLFCLLSPFLLIFGLAPFGISDQLAGYFISASIFLPPFLIFIPFRFAKLNSVKEKIIFILVGLTVPAIYIYLAIKTISGMFGGIIFG